MRNFLFGKNFNFADLIIMWLGLEVISMFFKEDRYFIGVLAWLGVIFIGSLISTIGEMWPEIIAMLYEDTKKEIKR